MNGLIRVTFASIASLLFLCTTFVANAQDGRLVLHVTPHEAYILVDGHAIGVANKHRTLKLNAGDHKVELLNYGYAPDRRDVTITAGQSTELEVNLNAVPSGVSVPFV